jgi:hypothetical protein
MGTELRRQLPGDSRRAVSARSIRRRATTFSPADSTAVCTGIEASGVFLPPVPPPERPTAKQHRRLEHAGRADLETAARRTRVRIAGWATCAVSCRSHFVDYGGRSTACRRRVRGRDSAPAGQARWLMAGHRRTAEQGNAARSREGRAVRLNGSRARRRVSLLRSNGRIDPYPLEFGTAPGPRPDSGCSAAEGPRDIITHSMAGLPRVLCLRLGLALLGCVLARRLGTAAGRRSPSEAAV